MEAQVSSESEQRGNLSLREQSWLDERNDLRDEISSGTVFRTSDLILVKSHFLNQFFKILTLFSIPPGQEHSNESQK